MHSLRFLAEFPLIADRLIVMTLMVTQKDIHRMEWTGWRNHVPIHFTCLGSWNNPITLKKVTSFMDVIPLSIWSAVSSPSDLIVIPLAFNVFCTRLWAAVVFAWGLMNTKAAFFSSQFELDENWLKTTAPAKGHKECDDVSGMAQGCGWKHIATD